MTDVKVNLDRRRAYRNEGEQRATWVGPGEVTVPAWVAQEWGMAAQTGGEPQPTEQADQELDDLGLTAEQSQALRDAGYVDRAGLRAASDEDLQAVPGVGRATVRNLREQLG